MKKTLWMVLLMIAAIGVVGCSKTDEETAKDLAAAEKAADTPKTVKSPDVGAVAKPMLDTLTKTVADNAAVADAVESMNAVASLDSRDKVMEDQLALMTSMVGVLEGVTDKATAEKAKPEMTSLNTKAEAVKLRADKLGEPSQEEEESLKAKYGPQLEEVGGKIMAQMMRLMAKPEAMAVIQDSMSKGSDPKPETPKIEAPKIEAPIETPKIETPKIEAPIEAPKIEAPKVEIPELKMPG